MLSGGEQDEETNFGVWSTYTRKYKAVLIDGGGSKLPSSRPQYSK
jgi:hypothetical protein